MPSNYVQTEVTFHEKVTKLNHTARAYPSLCGGMVLVSTRGEHASYAAEHGQPHSHEWFSKNGLKKELNKVPYIHISILVRPLVPLHVARMTRRYLSRHKPAPDPCRAQFNSRTQVSKRKMCASRDPQEMPIVRRASPCFGQLVQKVDCAAFCSRTATLSHLSSPRIAYESPCSPQQYVAFPTKLSHSPWYSVVVKRRVPLPVARYNGARWRYFVAAGTVGSRTETKVTPSFSSQRPAKGGGTSHSRGVASTTVGTGGLCDAFTSDITTVPSYTIRMNGAVLFVSRHCKKEEKCSHSKQSKCPLNTEYRPNSTYCTSTVALVCHYIFTRCLAAQ